MQKLPDLLVEDLIREVGDLHLQVVQRNKRIAQLEEELDSLSRELTIVTGDRMNRIRTNARLEEELETLRAAAVSGARENAASRLFRSADDPAAAGAGEEHTSDLAR